MSGTPPPDMLGAAHVVQVAGDARTARFSAPTPTACRCPATWTAGCSRGYHWGNLTSGSWLQALWLLLIPFGFINAAQFMLPPPAEPTGGLNAGLKRTIAVGSHAVAGAMLRLVGLVMTCVLALVTSYILASMAALRAAHQANVIEVWHHVLPPIGLAGSVLVVVGLYAVGGRVKTFEYKRTSEPHIDVRSGLASTDFFRGDPSVKDLRRLHLAAGAAVAGLPGAFTLLNETRDDFDLWVRGVLIAVVWIVGGLVLFVGDLSGTNTLAFSETHTPASAAPFSWWRGGPAGRSSPPQSPRWWRRRSGSDSFSMSIASTISTTRRSATISASPFWPASAACCWQASPCQ